jgi:hypothetical protein
MSKEYVSFNIVPLQDKITKLMDMGRYERAMQKEIGKDLHFISQLTQPRVYTDIIDRCGIHKSDARQYIALYVESLPKDGGVE